MTPDLSKEVTDALHASDREETQARDPATQKIYVVREIELDRLERAQQTTEAIQRGYDQIARGESQDLDDAFNDVERELGLTSEQ